MAVASAVTAGLAIVVAAGNEHVDASTRSPASEPLAITVGAIGQDDSATYFSNYGKGKLLSIPPRPGTPKRISQTNI
jgi:hypothetical protein